MLQIALAPSGEIRLITDGVTVELDSFAVKQIIALAVDVPPSRQLSEGRMTLPEDHPMWEHHSGGGRHGGKPWTMPVDLDGARQLRRHLAGKACGVFFDMILVEPGRLFTSQEIVDANPEVFSSASAVAGSLAGFVKPGEELDRAFPFTWWEGADGGPTRYAIRPSVASIFVAAGG